MARVVNCSRCATVTSDETEEELVARVQQHNRQAHRTFLSREQVLLLARMHSWGQRRRSVLPASSPGESWLGVVRVPWGARPIN